MVTLGSEKVAPLALFTGLTINLRNIRTGMDLILIHIIMSVQKCISQQHITENGLIIPVTEQSTPFANFIQNCKTRQFSQRRGSNHYQIKRFKKLNKSTKNPF